MGSWSVVVEPIIKKEGGERGKKRREEREKRREEKRRERREKERDETGRLIRTC
jgi:hypothetical protein